MGGGGGREGKVVWGKGGESGVGTGEGEKIWCTDNSTQYKNVW